MTFPKFLPSLKGLGFLIHAYPGLTPWANLIAAAARLVLRQLQPLADPSFAARLVLQKL